ncbi:hypothetical protein HDV00_001117 [Rhizophlyctis rosea]|nr:hypothetical protein HDV00_001117 [Rhizophlyctis rosea]
MSSLHPHHPHTIEQENSTATLPQPATQGRPARRYTVGAYLKAYWHDYLSLALMGALGLVIYSLRPAPTRNFPLTFSDGEVIYPQFAYPLRQNIIPIWLAAFLAFIFGFLTILLMQIRVRSFHDFNSGFLGLLYSLVTAAVFQVFLKWLIGGLRPHFLAVCQPRIDFPAGTGYKQIMVDRSVCTGDDKRINDALESFPSGHSTAAFAGLVYMALYLNAKLKIFSNYHPSYPKFVLFFAPILGATLIASSLTIDEYHNWYDCLAGAIIGTMMAFAAFRFVYAGIWDWRVNHIPLVRNPEWEAEETRAYATRSHSWRDVDTVKM